MSNPDTVAEQTLFQLLYVLPWTTVCIIALLMVWKPDQLVHSLQDKAAYMGVDVRTMLVTTFIAIVGALVLFIGGWKLLAYLREERVDKAAAMRILDLERSALVALFNNLDGKNWFNKSNWCSDEPINRWHGVKVDPVTARVSKLILPENRLGGTIPAEIALLQGLIEIDFRRNDIGGTIPPAMLSLKKLQGLYLFENRLRGEIPLKLCELPNLSGIYLFNNNFDNHAEAAAAFRAALPDGSHVFV